MLAVARFRAFCLQLSIQKYTVCNIQNYNFAYYLIWCEILSLTLREVHRLRMFGNRVLRRIFGTKRDEETEKWRRLHYDELYHLNASPDIVWGHQN